MYYHIDIIQKHDYKELKINLSREELMSRIIEPYQQGNPIVINGKTIQLDTINRIRIFQTETLLDDEIKKFQVAYEKDSGQFKIFGPSPTLQAIESGKYVSDEFITGPPGYLKTDSEKSKTAVKIKNASAKQKVFIVHGRDNALKDETCVFLNEIGFEPIVLHRQADGGLTILEKFEKYSDVSYAFILLTPDDYGYAANQLKRPEGEREGNFRARQNVIFELGFFIGRLKRSNVCCLYKNVEIPSDISGLIYKEIKNSIQEVGYEIIKELKNAGLKPSFED